MIVLLEVTGGEGGLLPPQHVRRSLPPQQLGFLSPLDTISSHAIGRRGKGAAFIKCRVVQFCRVQARDNVIVLDSLDTASSFHDGLTVRIISQFDGLSDEPTGFAGRTVFGQRQIQVVDRLVHHLVVVEKSGADHYGRGD